MDFEKQFEIVKKLEIDQKKIILEKGDFQIYIVRPSKVPNSLKRKYTTEKNFQIFLKNLNTGDKFRPNHLRVMIDLNLRVKQRPDLKHNFLHAFDNIYNGEDPIHTLKKLEHENFEFELSPVIITGVLAQLFIIEQDYNYGGRSNYGRPSLFFQGWVRSFICAEREIDNLSMSLCRFMPSPVKYTCQNDSNHKKYNPEAAPLWYLNKK